MQGDNPYGILGVGAFHLVLPQHLSCGQLSFVICHVSMQR